MTTLSSAVFTKHKPQCIRMESACGSRGKQKNEKHSFSNSKTGTCSLTHCAAFNVTALTASTTSADGEHLHLNQTLWQTFQTSQSQDHLTRVKQENTHQYSNTNQHAQTLFKRQRHTEAEQSSNVHLEKSIKYISNLATSFKNSLCSGILNSSSFLFSPPRHCKHVSSAYSLSKSPPTETRHSQ